MNIIFQDKRFERMVTKKLLAKEYGSIRGKKILDRLDQMHIANTLEETRHLPGKYHELVENRKGQWACMLDGNYRLIFKPQEDPIPVNDNGQYVWSEIKGIEIIEVVDYH